MAKRRVMFTFSEELVKEPIIYNISQQFKVVTNIRLADVSESQRWIILELEGKEKDIEDSLAWATSKGVRVDPVSEEQ
ncbi:NIL domain-containing protein [Chloroflexota bacterium]